MRILATTGEPINKEAWTWYFENVGKKRCPIVNLSGGTEVGGAIPSAIPIMSLKPCTVGYPIPGFDVDVLDDAGKHTDKGYVIIIKDQYSIHRIRGCFSIDGLADTLTKSISIPVTNQIKVLLGFNV